MGDWIRAGLALVLAGAIGMGCSGSSSMSTHVTVPQAQIQAKLSAKFPIEKDQNGVHVTLSNPRLMLDAGTRRMAIETDVLVRLPTVEVGPRARAVTPPPLTGTALVDGSIAYDKGEATVYFQDGTLKDLRLSQIPPQGMEKIKEAASSGIATRLEKLPVYTLDPSKIEQKAATYLLQDVTVGADGLDVTVGLGG